MTNRLSKLRPFLAGCIGMLVLNSCNLDQIPNLDNAYLPKYEGSIALLLVNDTISIREFLEDNISDTSTYDITSEERVIFSYDIDTDFNVGSDFVEIQSFKNRKSFDNPLGSTNGIPLPNDVDVNISRRVAFNFPATKDEQLDSLYYNSALFELTVISEFSADVEYTFSTSAFKNDAGDTINIESTVVNTNGFSSSDYQSISLDGYKTNLITESDSNRFLVNIDATVKLKAGTILTGSEELFFDLDITNPQFDVIFGSFGEDTFRVDQQRVDLSFFEDLGGEGIIFEAPSIQFNVNNGFGLPIGIDFSNVYTIKGSDTTYFAGSFPDNPQIADAAPVADFGDYVNTSLIIDNTNSNIQDLLKGSPDEMVFNLRGYSNYQSTQSNWLDDESAMDITAKVSIPLSFSMDGFEFDNEVELDDLSDLEGTKDLTLLVNTISEFPFDGILDLYMLDEDSMVMNSIEGSVLLTTPTQFDASGKVSEPSENRTEISLDAQAIDDLIHASTLKFIIRLDSYNAAQGEFVEVFADYDLQLKIGVSGTVSVDINGN